KKDRRYLLQSLVDPQAVVATGYGNIALTLADGTAVAGQFRSEKDGNVTIRDTEGKESVIPASEIASRSPVVSTMPPVGLLMSRSDLRDLVAYLVSLQ